MKKLTILSFYLASFGVHSQDKFNIYTELVQGASYFFGNALSLDSDATIGGQFNTSKGVFIIYAKYRYGGYLSDEFAPYAISYSELGMGGKYRVFRKEKKISPFVRIDVLREITSRVPTDDFSDFDLNNYFYTPFIGNLSIGVDFNLVKNLNFNIGLGVDVREMRSYYYYYNQFLYDWSTSNGITLQLGMSYSFSVGKKQNETLIE